MEAPIIIKPKIEKEYEMEYNKSKILLRISLSGSLMYISVDYIDDIHPYHYQSSFDKDSLSKINPIFTVFSSIKETLDQIIILIEAKKFSLNKINENQLDLVLKAIIFTTEEKISLSLYKNSNLTKDDIINNLINIVQNLTKRVEELEKWKKNNEKNDNNNNDTKKEETTKEEKNKITSVSSILTNENELKLIEQRLKSGIFSNKKISYKLLYCGTKDGDSSKTFHEKCDNIQNQLVLVKTKESLKFGGYTRLGFNSSNSVIKDKDAFLFSFDIMKCYDAIEGKETIYCYASHGPTFGYDVDIKIPNNFFSSQGQVHTKMNRFKTSQDYELNGGNQFFTIKEVEVFQVLFE